MDAIGRFLNNLFRRNKKKPQLSNDNPLNYEQASSAPPPYQGGEPQFSTVNPDTGVTTTYMGSGAVVAQAPGKTPYRVKPSDEMSAKSAEQAVAARSEGMNAAFAEQISAATKYPDVPVSELVPVEGHPGHFTNGQGKGGHDPTTGYSLGTWPVYDSSGKYLGENATLIQGDTSTNYGYSYGGTPIPRDIDLSKHVMGQSEALQRAGLNGDELTPFGQGDHNDNKDTRNALQNSDNGYGKGADMNGVPTAIPEGMAGVEGAGLVMNQDTALKAAGLNIDSLQGWEPSKGGPDPETASQASTIPQKGGPLEAIEAQVASPYDQQVFDGNNPNKGGPAPEAVYATAPSAPVKGGPAEAASAAISSPYDQEVLTANRLNGSAPTEQDVSKNRLEAGRAQRLDPDGLMAGGANFDVAGEGTNPVDGIGSDPTAGGGDGSYKNFAI